MTDIRLRKVFCGMLKIEFETFTYAQQFELLKEHYPNFYEKLNYLRINKGLAYWFFSEIFYIHSKNLEKIENSIKNKGNYALGILYRIIVGDYSKEPDFKENQIVWLEDRNEYAQIKEVPKSIDKRIRVLVEPGITLSVQKRHISIVKYFAGHKIPDFSKYKTSEQFQFKGETMNIGDVVKISKPSLSEIVKACKEGKTMNPEDIRSAVCVLDSLLSSDWTSLCNVSAPIRGNREPRPYESVDVILDEALSRRKIAFMSSPEEYSTIIDPDSIQYQLEYKKFKELSDKLFQSFVSGKVGN